MNTFKLPYYCSNGGDGSVIVRFCQSLAEAKTKDDEMEKGWGESSASTVELRIEDGKLFFKTYRKVDDKYQYVWLEVNS